MQKLLLGLLLAFATGARATAVTDAAKARAQQALDFVVPDSSSWIQSQGCSACHRGGITLYGASLSAHTGFKVDQSHTAGVGSGYIADHIVSEQSGDGGWYHNGYQFVKMKTAFEVFGLAGYLAYSGDSSYRDQLKNGLLFQAQNSAVAPYDYSGGGFPSTGLEINQNDWASTPVAPNWTVPSAETAVAASLLLANDPALNPSERLQISNLLRGLADGFEFLYPNYFIYWSGDYALPASAYGFAWQTQDTSWALLAMTAAGRTPATNTAAAQMRDAILAQATPGSGWVDSYTSGQVSSFTTGIALYALCKAGVRADPAAVGGKAVIDGLNYLTNQVSANGSFGAPGISSADIPSTFALLGLGCYGVFNVDVQGGGITSVPACTNNVTTVTFPITVTNSGYSTTTYTVSPSGGVPGTTLSAAPAQLVLAPGATGTSTIKAVFPVCVTSSSVPITVSISYTTATGVAGTTTGYTVFVGNQPSASAPGTLTNLGALPEQVGLGSTVQLSATVATVGGSAVKQGGLTFYVGNTALQTVFADANGNFTTSWTVSGATMGSQTISAVYGGFSDGAGTEFGTSSAQAAVTVVILRPDAPVVTSTKVDGNGVLTVTGTGVPGGSANLFVNGQAAGTGPINPDGSFSLSTQLSVGDGQAVTVSQTTSGGTSDLASGGAVSYQPCRDFGPAKPFNVFVTGGFTGQWSDVEGAVAAGGNVQVQGYSIGQKLPGGLTALVAGGNISFNQGTLYGNGFFGGTSSITQATVRGTVQKGTPVDFAGAALYESVFSSALAGMAANGTVKLQWGGIYLTGTDAKLNVFNIPATAFNGAWGVNFSIPSGSHVLINVTGSGAVALRGMGFNSAPAAGKMLINFKDATSLALSGIGLYGSILAPSAAVQFDNGQVNGQIVAQSFSGQGQVNGAAATAFDTCINTAPASQPTPTSPTSR